MFNHHNFTSTFSRKNRTKMFFTCYLVFILYSRSEEILNLNVLLLLRCTRRQEPKASIKIIVSLIRFLISMNCHLLYYMKTFYYFMLKQLLIFENLIVSFVK